MKKIVACSIILCLLFSLSACKNTAQPEIENSGDTITEGADDMATPEAKDTGSNDVTDWEPDPNKIYFYDTYGEIGANPTIMWGDLSWSGWFDVAKSLNKEENGWYSFRMSSTSVPNSYNMLIFFNGLPDSDPEAVQWVWHSINVEYNGNFFIADYATGRNENEASFQGVQRNVTSFATIEEAEVAIAKALPEPIDGEASITLEDNPEAFFAEPLADDFVPVLGITARQLVDDITVGWNLGNTLDAWTASTNINNSTITELERTWGNPLTTQATIDTIQAAGFNAVRVPVTWHKACDEDYNINETWMARVRTVVDYAYNRGLYVILNTHHDEAIFKLYDADYDETSKAFTRIWEQICDEFKDYDHRLVYEGLNEPRTKGTAGEWNGGTPEERENLNKLHQDFVDTVRASGGNNANRILLICTYAASATPIAMNNLIMPNDTVKDRLIASIHAYEPYHFALDENASSVVKIFSATNNNDTSRVREPIDRAHNIFVSNGFPVIMGEFGSINRNNTEYRAEHAAYYSEYAKSLGGIACFWWDDGGNFRLLNRRDNTFFFPEIVDALFR